MQLRKAIFIFSAIFSFSASGQQIKVTEGDLKSLKGTTEFAIEFTYNDMVIGDGSKSEEEYVQEIKQRWNDKQPGKGAGWELSWVEWREQLYEPAFISAFENKSELKVPGKSAKYTMIINTGVTEPGWDAGMFSHVGMIEGEAWIVESSDREKIIVKMQFLKCRGVTARGGDFDAGKRISEAYKTTGKGFGKYIKNRMK
jgi:hypothetical protein